MTKNCSITQDVKNKHSLCNNACLVKGIRILVVDDNKFSLDLLARLLNSMGFRLVSKVESVKEALKLLSVIDFDLIISDIEMDAINGLSFLKMLRKGPPDSATDAERLRRYMNVPFIMVTGHSTVDYIESARNAGVSAYITKPISPTVIFERITQVLKRPCGI